MAQETLLPDNRTAFEEAADLTGARIADLHIGLRQLVQPHAVLAPHLPWLAWGLSVDLWDKDWPEEKKRARTARSLPFHAIKGTQTAIAEALAVMGAEARRFIVPPAKTYLSKALTEMERAAYLDRFAQLRIYPFIARGVSGRNTRFLSAPDGPGTAFAGPNNPVSIAETKYIRAAKLFDRGAETDLTVRTVTPERVGDFNAIEYDEVVLAPKPTAAIHLGDRPKAQAFLIDDIGVRQRIVRIPRAVDYSYRLGREQYTTVLPKGDLIDVRPQQVAEKHAAQATSLFPGAAGQRVSGACLPETIAWRHLYDRWHIHDPDRVLDERKRSTHLGYTRLGMPPYTAEVLTRIKGKRPPRTAGRFVNGYVVAASTKPVADARARRFDQCLDFRKIIAADHQSMIFENEDPVGRALNGPQPQAKRDAGLDVGHVTPAHPAQGGIEEGFGPALHSRRQDLHVVRMNDISAGQNRVNRRFHRWTQSRIAKRFVDTCKHVSLGAAGPVHRGPDGRYGHRNHDVGLVRLGKPCSGCLHPHRIANLQRRVAACCLNVGTVPPDLPRKADQWL